MLFTKDMKDLISLFKKNKVKYVLIGGFAVNYYNFVDQQTVDTSISAEGADW